MNYAELNKITKDLEFFRRKSKMEQKIVVHEITDDVGSQGEEGIYYEVYAIPQIEDNLFIKFEIRTDSYGCNDRLVGFEFVRPTEKIVKAFESI
jgi:hypothetical protein